LNASGGWKKRCDVEIHLYNLLILIGRTFYKETKNIFVITQFSDLLQVESHLVLDLNFQSTLANKQPRDLYGL